MLGGYLSSYWVTGLDGISDNRGQEFLPLILLAIFWAFPGHGSDFCERLIEDIGCLFSNATLWALNFAVLVELMLLPLGWLCLSVVLRWLVALLLVVVVKYGSSSTLKTTTLRNMK